MTIGYLGDDELCQWDLSSGDSLPDLLQVFVDLLYQVLSCLTRQDLL